MAIHSDNVLRNFKIPALASRRLNDACPPPDALKREQLCMRSDARDYSLWAPVWCMPRACTTQQCGESCMHTSVATSFGWTGLNFCATGSTLDPMLRGLWLAFTRPWFTCNMRHQIVVKWVWDGGKQDVPCASMRHTGKFAYMRATEASIILTRTQNAHKSSETHTFSGNTPSLGCKYCTSPLGNMR